MCFFLTIFSGVFTKILLLKTYQMIFEQRSLLFDWLLDNNYLKVRNFRGNLISRVGKNPFFAGI